MYWLIFDKDTSRIIGLQNYTPESEYNLEVSEDAYVDFMTNPDKKNNFVVKYDLSKKEYVLLAYEQPKLTYDIKDVIYHVPKQSIGDCIITRTTEWTLIVNVNEQMLLDPRQLCKFSITKANDPHLLIRTFTATVQQITHGYTVQFEYPEEHDNVSIYTPKIFNSYGFIDETI
jgi:hypothetical protein